MVKSTKCSRPFQWKTDPLLLHSFPSNLCTEIPFISEFPSPSPQTQTQTQTQALKSLSLGFFLGSSLLLLLGRTQGLGNEVLELFILQGFGRGDLVAVYYRIYEKTQWNVRMKTYAEYQAGVGDKRRGPAGRRATDRSFSLAQGKK